MVICCSKMNRIPSSRYFLPGLLFGLGYLTAWVTRMPDSGHALLERTLRNEPQTSRSRPIRPEGSAESERVRLKRAGNLDDLDMGLFLEEINRIKTFESNTFDTGISQELCECLAISRAERRVIDSAIQSSLEKIQRLQLTRIETIEAGDSVNRFVIHPFPAEGAALTDELRATILETLGENRYFLFSKITGDAMDDTFWNSGAEDVHITIIKSGIPGSRSYETMLSHGNKSRRFETEGVPATMSHLFFRP